LLTLLPSADLYGCHIQAELWALLHFIMPELFDSFTDFTDWFSKVAHHITNSTQAPAQTSPKS
jgi:hypothetical protein